MSKQNKKTGLPPIAYLFLAIIGMFLFPTISSTISNFLGSKNFPTPQNMSIGNQLLISQNVTNDKKEAIELVKKGDYEQAKNQFTTSLKTNPNDPETLIYAQNTSALATKNYLKIATVVPIGSNINIAQEILRGVATAQKEINENGGINGQKLLVQIVDDKNDPELAKKAAEELIKDPKILAVIGSNASNPSLAAAPIYKQSGLLMITPTSFSDNLSGLAFRIVPSTKVSGKTLADYVVNNAKKTKIAICYDSSSTDSISFKDEFTSSLLSLKATIIPMVCDLAKQDFYPQQIINTAINQGADSLFAANHIDHVEKVIELTRFNQDKLALFSSGTMYNIKTLENGNFLKGLILVAPYHPDLNPVFAKKMEQLWKGRVSWRTATSFDTTNVVITALQKAQTRTEIIQVLRGPLFSLEGATGTVKFDGNTGDRLGQPVIVQVQNYGNNYEFSLLNK